MASIAMSSGHGAKVSGASGILVEVPEARRVVDRVCEILTGAGFNCKKFHENTATSVNQNLTNITNWHNAQSRERDVSIHFNAYQSTSKPMGTECLYLTQPTLASEISAAMAKAGGFINRGGKKRTDLWFLNKTTKPAVLLEVCFVDSQTDASLYQKNFEAICQAIASSIASVKLPSEPPPVDPPVEPPTEPPPVEITGNHIVKIDVTVDGNPTVVFNGSKIREGAADAGTVTADLAVEGDVRVSINGEDFQIEEPVDPVQYGIKASVFGGASDPNNSAYSPYDTITDKELSVALPYKWTGHRPLVEVFNPANDKMVVCEIRDVGPWLTDDPYWELGTRPVAETCWKTNTGLPRGKYQGKVPNGAGIDLTPAAAKAVGISGMGSVNWQFVEDTIAA